MTVDGDDGFGGIDTVAGEQGKLSAPSAEYFVL
jgi:hypothetical protein